jgi:DNA-binding CsgD family transcriptional regulator
MNADTISPEAYGERRIDNPLDALVGSDRFDVAQGSGPGMVRRGVLMLATDGTVRAATRGARRIIATYFGDDARVRNGLPARLRRWAVPRAGARATFAGPSSNALVIYRADRRLVLRRLAEPTWTVLLLEEEPRRSSIDALGLTRRETEVAACLALGKTNAEIAAILGMRARTVGKHLERIYEKLGVETRTAAVARVIEAAKTLTV